MKTLQPLNFLIRHLRPSYPSYSRHFPPLPFLFYCAHVARPSVTQSYPSLHIPQTRYNSTTTSSKEAFQSNISSQNADDTSTSFSTHEALDSSHPTSLPPKGDPAHQEPGYHLSFTCKPCEFRSAHSISKQGYHNGTVLITCPNCKNRHVISDHLKVRSLSSHFCNQPIRSSRFSKFLQKLIRRCVCVASK